MKRMILALSVLSVGILLVSSCNKASVIGADLIEGDQANIKHTDSVTFNTTTIEDDSVLVYNPDPFVQYNNFFIGNFDDPVFGNTTANLNAQLWTGSNAPNFDGAVLDSVILILRYDSINTYGDLITDPSRIGVYPITENIDLDKFYYSNDTFQYDMNNPLAETNDFIPKYGSADTIRVVDYTLSSEGDTITLPAHLRIPLSEEFGNQLLDFPYTNNAAFLEQFNGIVVKALNPTKGIMSFNLISAVSNMTLFYRTEDTIRQQYRFIFSSSGVKFSNFKHNYTGSTVDSFIDNKTKGDSLLFVQSLAGSYIKIEFPDPEKFGDIIVNKAELEFTFAELSNDDITYYPPLERSIMAFDNNNGGLLFISDYTLGIATNINWFGGTVYESIDDFGEDIYAYSYNISSHFQKMVEGTVGNTIFIRAFPIQERARRAIFYGPKHSKYPAKFKLTYTVLNP